MVPIESLFQLHEPREAWIDENMVMSCVGIGFNRLDPEDKISLKFSKDAPYWRIVKQGLNLLATCKTDTCAAYKKYVWVQKGIGKFDIVDIIFQGTLCPACKKPTEDAESVGYWKCLYTVDGKMIKPERKSVHQSGTAPAKDFTTFKHSEAQWIELKITTEEPAPGKVIFKENDISVSDCTDKQTARIAFMGDIPNVICVGPLPIVHSPFRRSLKISEEKSESPVLGSPSDKRWHFKYVTVSMGRDVMRYYAIYDDRIEIFRDSWNARRETYALRRVWIRDYKHEGSLLRILLQLYAEKTPEFPDLHPLNDKIFYDSFGKSLNDSYTFTATGRAREALLVVME